MRPIRADDSLIGNSSGITSGKVNVTNMTLSVKSRIDTMGVYDGVLSAYGRCTYGNWKGIYDEDKYDDVIYW
jgi:hypothetical protein